MTVRISPMLWLCMAVGAGGCNPKEEPSLPRPAETPTTTEIASPLREPPPIPDHPDYPDDSAYVISAPDAPAVVYYRRLMSLAFVDSTSSQDVAAFFQKYAAQVVGGVPGMGEYYIQVADPGPTWSKVDSLVNAMNAEPGVEVVAELIREMPKGAQGDISRRPPIPDNPREPDDSAFTAVSPADPRFVYYRRLYDVVFLDNATDVQVLAFFAKYQASIVGGAPLVDIYTVQVPDPGANFQAVDSLVNAMDGEPGVEVAAPIARTSPKGPLHGRYPNGERHQ